MIISTDDAVNFLNNGKVVCMPTETVYGLAARYDNVEAINNIYALKQRPADKPLILHISNQQWLTTYCHSIPSYVDALIDHFWPGPLTLILPKKDIVPNEATACQPTVGVRMPAHQAALKLIESLGAPVFAPSANLYQQLSPTRTKHIFAQFGDDIAVVEGGACQVGIESTIVLALDEHSFSILRPGHISLAEIQAVISVPHVSPNKGIKSPGQDLIHYRPKVAMKYFSDTALLQHVISQSTLRYKVMVFTPLNWLPLENQVLMPRERKQYEPKMYHCWYENANAASDVMYIELPPKTAEWQGIRDKIVKAADNLRLSDVVVKKNAAQIAKA